MTLPTQSDPQFKLRLPSQLKNRIEGISRANNRSLNAEIVTALEHWVQKDILDTVSRFNEALSRLSDDERLSLGQEAEQALRETYKALLPNMSIDDLFPPHQQSE